MLQVYVHYSTGLEGCSDEQTEMSRPVNETDAAPNHETLPLPRTCYENDDELYTIVRAISNSKKKATYSCKA